MTSLTATRTSPAWPAYAAVSAGLALVLSAIGAFWSPLASYETTTYTTKDLLSYLLVVPMIAVGLGIVFGLVVRTATPANADRRALVLSIVGVLSLVVFWTGLPPVLAGGAICCALSSGRASTRAKVAIGLAVLTVGVATFAALAG